METKYFWCVIDWQATDVVKETLNKNNEVGKETLTKNNQTSLLPSLQSSE